MKMMKAKL